MLLVNPDTGSKPTKGLNKLKILEIPPFLENGVLVLDFSSRAQILNDYFIMHSSTLDNGSDISQDLTIYVTQLTIREFFYLRASFLKPGSAQMWLKEN